MELLRQHADPIDAVFVPVGGGGLIAGIAAYVKHIRPEIRVIGVEPEDSPTLERAMAKRRRVTLPRVGLFVDGVAIATADVGGTEISDSPNGLLVGMRNQGDGRGFFHNGLIDDVAIWNGALSDAEIALLAFYLLSPLNGFFIVRLGRRVDHQARRYEPENRGRSHSCGGS